MCRYLRVFYGESTITITFCVTAETLHLKNNFKLQFIYTVRNLNRLVERNADVLAAIEERHSKL